MDLTFSPLFLETDPGHKLGLYQVGAAFDFLTRFLVSYLITVCIETPILLVFLSQRHPLSRRFFCGLWLTACTYPVVWFVLPPWIDPSVNRVLYLTVAETFAPAAECLLFWLAFRDELGGSRSSWLRDFAAIIAANLASFGFGEIAYQVSWL